MFHDLTFFFLMFRVDVNSFIFPVMYLKAMQLTSQNGWPTKSLSGQMVKLARHFLLTGHLS